MFNNERPLGKTFEAGGLQGVFYLKMSRKDPSDPNQSPHIGGLTKLRDLSLGHHWRPIVYFFLKEFTFSRVFWWKFFHFIYHSLGNSQLEGQKKRNNSALNFLKEMRTRYIICFQDFFIWPLPDTKIEKNTLKITPSESNSTQCQLTATNLDHVETLKVLTSEKSAIKEELIQLEESIPSFIESSDLVKSMKEKEKFLQGQSWQTVSF